MQGRGEAALSGMADVRRVRVCRGFVGGVLIQRLQQQTPRQILLDLAPLMQQHAGHDHFETNQLKVLDAEPRDDGVARIENLLAPVVGAVSHQLLNGRAAAARVGLVEQDNRATVSEREGDLFLAICGEEVCPRRGANS